MAMQDADGTFNEYIFNNNSAACVGKVSVKS